jgi:hypothetical protein
VQAGFQTAAGVRERDRILIGEEIGHEGTKPAAPGRRGKRAARGRNDQYGDPIH